MSSLNSYWLAMDRTLGASCLRWSPQDIANAFWALATLGYGSEKLFEKVCRCYPDLPIHTFTAQNCGNILWALARRGRGLELQGLAEAVAQHVSQLQCDEQSLSSCVWALAVLRQRMLSLPLLRSVRGEELKSFSPESLCVLAWTCGLLGVTEHPTGLLASALEEKSGDLSISQLTSATTAFARIWPSLRKRLTFT